MEDCIFCRIAADQAPNYRIYEDDLYVAFLDIYPYCKGHTLLIPKDHYRWIWDISHIGRFMETAQKIANHYRQILQTDTVYTMALGEAVPHAHLHLIPQVQDCTDNLFTALSHLDRSRLEHSTAQDTLAQLSLVKA